MWKGYARLLLVATVVLAGASTCPHGVRACETALRVMHDCCSHPALRASACCCAAGQASGPVLGVAAASADPGQLSQATTPAALTWVEPATGPTTAALGAPWSGGRPLADTLVRRHCILLL